MTDFLPIAIIALLIASTGTGVGYVVARKGILGKRSKQIAIGLVATGLFLGGVLALNAF